MEIGIEGREKVGHYDIITGHKISLTSTGNEMTFSDLFIAIIFYTSVNLIYDGRIMLPLLSLELLNHPTREVLYENQ